MSEIILVKSSKSVLCVVAMAAFGVVGCASDATELTGDDAPQALQAPGGGNVLANPEGVYFAEVKANGTGCPAGTWNTELAPDGQTFTTTFSAYEAMVDEKTSISVKDCLLAIKLHSPQGLSYSVSQFHYAGYAFMDQGVSGRQLASYYFQGNPVERDEVRTELKGPYDDSYLFSDSIELSDGVVWSPCGVDRDLNIVTRLRMQNSSPRRTGYMNLSAVDGSTKLVFKLAWKECGPDAKPDAGRPSSDGRDDGNHNGGRDNGGRSTGSHGGGRDNGRQISVGAPSTIRW